MSLAHAVAQLRHLYAQMVEERVKSPVRAAIGILGPAIEEIERFQMNLPAESSTAPRAAGEDAAYTPFCACGRRLTECDGSRSGCNTRPFAPAPRQPSDPARCPMCGCEGQAFTRDGKLWVRCRSRPGNSCHHEWRAADTNGGTDR